MQCALPGLQLPAQRLGVHERHTSAVIGHHGPAVAAVSMRALVGSVRSDGAGLLVLQTRRLTGSPGLLHRACLHSNASSTVVMRRSRPLHG